MASNPALDDRIVRVDEVSAGADQIYIRMSVEILDLPPESSGVHDVVRVHSSQVATARQCGYLIQPRCQAQIAAIVHQSHALPVQISPHGLNTAVGRTVVNKQQFESVNSCANTDSMA